MESVDIGVASIASLSSLDPQRIPGPPPAELTLAELTSAALLPARRRRERLVESEESLYPTGARKRQSCRLLRVSH